MHYAHIHVQLLVMRQHLGAADWLLWLDCDTLITNPRIGVHAVLDLARERAASWEETHLIISEDGVMINTGKGGRLSLATHHTASACNIVAEACCVFGVWQACFLSRAARRHGSF